MPHRATAVTVMARAASSFTVPVPLPLDPHPVPTMPYYSLRFAPSLHVTYLHIFLYDSTVHASGGPGPVILLRMEDSVSRIVPVPRLQCHGHRGTVRASVMLVH